MTTAGPCRKSCTLSDRNKIYCKTIFNKWFGSKRPENFSKNVYKFGFNVHYFFNLLGYHIFDTYGSVLIPLTYGLTGSIMVHINLTGRITLHEYRAFDGRMNTAYNEEMNLAHAGAWHVTVIVPFLLSPSHEHRQIFIHWK